MLSGGCAKGSTNKRRNGSIMRSLFAIVLYLDYVKGGNGVGGRGGGEKSERGREKTKEEEES